MKLVNANSSSNDAVGANCDVIYWKNRRQCAAVFETEFLIPWRVQWCDAWLACPRRSPRLIGAAFSLCSKSVAGLLQAYNMSAILRKMVRPEQKQRAGGRAVWRIFQVFMFLFFFHVIPDGVFFWGYVS